MKRASSTKSIYSAPPGENAGSWLLPGALLMAILAVAVGIWHTAFLSAFLKILLSTYLAAEILFYIYGKSRYAILNQPITRYPDPTRVRTAMDRFLNLQRVFHLDEFLSGWFLGTPADSIPRGNLIEFVAYGFFCREVDELTSDQKQAVLEFVAAAERQWSMSFSEGYHEDLRFMAHVWEPLRVSHKPLCMYAMTEIAARIAHVLLRWMGFEKGSQGAFTSWTSPSLSVQNYLWAEKNGVVRRSALAPDGRTAATTTSASLVPRADADDGGGALNTSAGMPHRNAAVSHHNHGKEEFLRGVAHNAAEHALDAAVAATSAAAASMAKQYPHAGQQYHLPPPRPSSPAFPIISTFRGMMERRVALPPPSPRRRRVRRQTDGSSSGGMGTGIPTIDSAMSVDVDSLGPETRNRQRQRGPPPAAVAATAPAPSTPPVVFLHGVGFGTLPYLYFVRKLMKACPDSPFILLEMPHVALRLCKEAESVDAVALAAVAAAQSLGFPKATFIGHSYGTFCVSRIVQLKPEAVHALALLDPVACLTCYPQLLYNFIYKTFALSTLLSSVLAAIDGVRFLCSRDLTISQAFCRKFHWSELMLFPEDITRKRYHSLIVLSGKDDLVPGELVRTQFEAVQHPATVMYHPELGHGGLLMDHEWSRQVIEAVKKMVHRGEEEGDEVENS